MFTLKRVAQTNNGIFGVLLFNGVPFALTLERPWLNNAARVSCIPKGTYDICLCSKSPDYGYAPSPKFGDVYQVRNVPGRAKVLMHSGNTIDDTEGCILIGECFAPINGRPGIALSKDALKEFMTKAGGANQVLTIEEVWHA